MASYLGRSGKKRGGGGGSYLGGGGKGKQKAEKKDSGGGGIGGFLEDTAKLTSGVATAPYHMGKDLVKEVAYNWSDEGRKSNTLNRLYEDGFHPERLITEDPFLRGVAGHADPNRPISSGWGQSFGNTLGRIDDIPQTLVGKGDYARAWREGGLPQMLVEDVANYAAIAGAAAKGLNVATNNAAAEASAATKTASILEDSAIPKQAKIVDDLSRQVEADQAAHAQAAAAIEQEARVIGPTAEAWDKAERIANQAEASKARLADAQGTLDGLQQMLDDSKAKIARGSEQPKALMGAYRMAESISRLGAQGANIPAKPFGLGMKMIGSAGQKLLSLDPNLAARLGEWVQAAGGRRANKRGALGVSDRRRAEGDTIIYGAREAFTEMDRLLPDDDLWHAMMLDLTGAPTLLKEAMNQLRLRLGDAFVERAFRELADSPEFLATPRALELADQIANGTLDPATLARVRRAQMLYKERVLTPMEERFVRGEGRMDPMTPAQAAEAQWQVDGTEANPAVIDDVKARQAATRAAADQQVRDLSDRLAEARLDIDLDPETFKNLSAVLQRNAQLADATATRLLDAAMSDPALMADLRGIPKLAKALDAGADQERLTLILSQYLEGAVTSKAKRNAVSAVKAAVPGMVSDGFTPLSRLRATGGSKAYERAVAAKAKADAAQAHADRVRQVADRLGASSEKQAQKVVRATDKLLKAQKKAADAAKKAQRARERIAAGAEAAVDVPADVLRQDAADAVRNARQAVVDSAAEERRALAAGAQDHLPDEMVAVPGGISEHWNAINEGLGLGEFNIKAAAAKIKGTDGKHAPRNAKWAGNSRHHTMADAWYTAYREWWNGIPSSRQRGLRKLTREEVKALYYRESGQAGLTGGRNDLAFGLDESIDRWASAAGRDHLDLNERARLFGEALRRERALRRIEDSGTTNGFSARDLDEFFASSTDPAMRALADDAALRGALEQGSIPTAAQAIYAGRIAERSAGISWLIPDQAALVRRLEGRPFEPFTTQEAERVLADVLGGEEPMHEFMGRWDAAGRPDLDGVFASLEQGVVPEWLTKSAAARRAGEAAVGRAERRVAEDLDAAWEAEANRNGQPASRAGDLTPAEVDRAIALTRASQEHVAADGVVDPFAYMDTLSPEDRVLLDRYAELMDSSRVKPAGEGRDAGPRLNPDEQAIRDAQIAARRARNPERAVQRAVDEAGAATVGRLADQAEGAASRAEMRAARLNPEEARLNARAEAISQAAPDIRRNQQQIDAMRRVERELRFSQKRLERLPERQAEELAAAMDDLANAPKRFRASLKMAHGAAAVFEKMTEELGDGTDPLVLDALNRAQLELTLTLRDVTRSQHSVIGLDEKGNRTTIPLDDPLIDPVYVPGGRIPERRAGSARGLEVQPGGKMKKSSAERQSHTGLIPNTARETERVFSQRLRAETGNKAATDLESMFGRRPAQVLGEGRAQELADEVIAAQEQYEAIVKRRKAEIAETPGEAKKILRARLKQVRPDLARQARETLRKANQALIDEMAAEGYVPWNPRGFNSNPDSRGIGTLIVKAGDEDAALTTSVVWVPEEVAKQFEQTFRADPKWDRYVRAFYDTPTNVWRDAVLAFSPRWQVNNVIGNTFVAVVGGGVPPGELFSAMRDAKALIRRDDLAFEVANAEALGTSPRRVARQERALGKAEARIEQMDPRLRAAVTGEDGMRVDPRIPQRGAGNAALDPNAPGQVNYRGPLKGLRTKWHDAAERSYNVNGFMDDMSRIAVFMRKHDRLTDAELAKFAADNPTIAARAGSMEALRREAAVKLSLDAMGNFRKMNEFERRLVRRVIPFYAWLKHVTKLAVRLPVYSPARFAWMAHLSDMYGEDPEFPFLLGSVAVGGGSFLRLPRGNPMEDVPVTPESGDLRDVVGQVGRSVGPIPRLASLGLTGIDPRTMMPASRPAGSGRVNENYGTDLFSPLSPTELLSVATDMTPQGRILRSAADTVTHGSPRLRYTSGDLIRDATGNSLPSNRSTAGEVAGWAGIPWTFKPNLADTRAGRDRRLAARAAAQASRRRPSPQPSGSGGGGSYLSR